MRKDTWIVKPGRITAFLLGAACASSAWASTPSFAAQQAFAVGGYPSAMASADVNADGKPDLIVTNEGDNTVSVLLDQTSLGDTAPSYGAQQTFAVGAYPEAVVTADINGDGLPDLVVPSTTDQTVSVLLNTTTPGDSTASFASQQTFAVGNYAESVRAMDVNGDGKPDIVVSNYNDQTISVLINTTAPGATTPSFADQQVIPLTELPFWMTVADVNGDGKLDIVVSDFASTTISVLLNTTAPGDSNVSFATEQMFDAGGSPIAIMAADVNGDGKMDFVVTNSGYFTVSVIINTTPVGSMSASFLAPQSFSVGSGALSVRGVDIDGDGKTDMVVANGDDNTLSVLINTTATGATTATFDTLAPVAVGADPQSLAIMDVDGDGKRDIAVTNLLDNTVSVVLNTSN